MQALSIGISESLRYQTRNVNNTRGEYRNFLRGGGTVNKSYQKVGVDP